jgi:hypothetical protein
MTDPDDYRRRQRANLLVFVIVAVLVLATVALLLALHRGIKREDCFAAGHHGCARIEEPD